MVTSWGRMGYCFCHSTAAQNSAKRSEALGLLSAAGSKIKKKKERKRWITLLIMITDDNRW